MSKKNNIDEIEKSIKGFEVCAKLAKVNAFISATGASVHTIVTGEPAIFSLVMFAISAGLLSYDTYQLYKLEKMANIEEDNKVKQLIKTNRKNI